VGPLAIVLFFAGLLVIILIHEGGHYLVARAFGFKVEEYFVGFGPRVWSVRRGEIEYGVKALPLGGYVKIAGMNPYEQVAEADLPRAYGSKPRWQRALTIFAGPGSHFVVGALLFGSLFAVFGAADSNLPLVSSVEQTLRDASTQAAVSSPALLAGVRPGDLIVGVGTRRHPTWDQLSSDTTDWAKHHAGTPLSFTIVRDGRTIRLDIVPVLAKVGEKTIGRIGITLGPRKRGLVGSAAGGVKMVGQTAWGSIQQIGHIFGPQGIGRVLSLLFTSTPRNINDSASVVGVGQQVDALGSAGDWSSFLYLLGYVTVFIGLVNLVPLPPFDGGHLAVLAVEKIRGKTIDMRKLIPVSAAVMGFFILFVMATVFLDITKPLPISP
jgi:membrane-associated protease RseP (regulator of RpoE activity)